jgi:SAM-dependent methyltransferase
LTEIRHVSSKTKKVSIWDRSIITENFTIIDAYRANRPLLKQRFIDLGYKVHETPHFLLFTRSAAPFTTIVHWFAPEEINADLSIYLVRELGPFGILTQTQHLGEILGGIVGLLFPDDVRRAWRFFGANTLQRYLLFLATAYTPPLPDYATIGMFATLYQRICELRIGDSFLDAGCASGFLPLLVAERIPFLQEIVGVDIQAASFAVAREIAEERHLTNVRFAQADLLSDNFSTIGRFDTVTALHVLEHFTEMKMYQVLTNLLKVTSKRLILAVPYERGEPEVAYGHEQLFSRAKLEAVGNWCIQQLGGKGRTWYEDCVGGLLLIERGSS